MQGSDIKMATCWTYKESGDFGEFLSGGPGVGRFWGAVLKRQLMLQQ